MGPVSLLVQLPFLARLQEVGMQTLANVGQVATAAAAAAAVGAAVATGPLPAASAAPAPRPPAAVAPVGRVQPADDAGAGLEPGTVGVPPVADPELPAHLGSLADAFADVGRSADGLADVPAAPEHVAPSPAPAPDRPAALDPQAAAALAPSGT